jgi:tryptophan-rich sensory protein
MESEPRTTPPWLSLLLCLTAAYAVNFVQLLAANRGLEFWFQTLYKPGWTLPTGVIAPISTVINGLLGVSLWHLLQNRQRVATALLAAYCLVATAWFWLFFDRHLLQASMIAAVIAACLMPYLIWRGWRIHPVTGLCLSVVLAWTVYWCAMNFEVIRLQRLHP